VSDGTALYRIWGEADLLLYIGISKDFGARWKQHAKRQPWWDEMRRLSVDAWYLSREEAEATEEAAIRAERPKYNKIHTAPLSRKRPRLQAESDPESTWDIYVPAALLEHPSATCGGMGIPCLELQLDQSIFGCAGFTLPRPCLLRWPTRLSHRGIVIKPGEPQTRGLQLPPSPATTGDGARRLIAAAAADLRGG